jgi:hypothetical protein
MTKTDTSLKQNIKDIIKQVKSLKVTPKKRMKRGGTGELPTYACPFVGRLSVSKFSTPPTNETFTKILTDKEQYDNEVAISLHLNKKLKGNQQNILYALNCFSFTKSELSENEKNTINSCIVDAKNADSFNKDAPIFYALEYYNGGENLSQFFKKNPKSYDDTLVCKIIKDINTLVENLEKVGVAHNDLANPANYTIKNNEISLIDFGEAKITNDFTKNQESLLEGLKNIIIKKSDVYSKQLKIITKHQLLGLCESVPDDPEEAFRIFLRARQLEQGAHQATSAESPPRASKRTSSASASRTPTETPTGTPTKVLRFSGGKKKSTPMKK